MQAGFNNLASIRLDAKGKPVGELNDQGKASIELFRRMDAVNADYAKGLVGAEVYQRFSDIGFLMHLGKAPSEAASIAANAASGAVLGSDTDKLMTKVKGEVGKLLADPWYSADWVRHLGGDNTQANTAQVHGWMRRYGTLLVQSGMYGDSDMALKAASEYLANPKVSAKVNGALYLRSEMPTAPPSRSQDEWFSRFIDAVPKARAKELHGSGDQVRLEFDEHLRARSSRGFHSTIPRAASRSTRRPRFRLGTPSRKSATSPKRLPRPRRSRLTKPMKRTARGCGARSARCNGMKAASRWSGMTARSTSPCWSHASSGGMPSHRSPRTATLASPWVNS
ncbi:hypothetical protein [Variovorax sp. J31P207]|uniref:hypothetical protein n=1 Tax=Variovorax sp. J31P207 TaxID=3053510 RepID=UPI002578E998|nr:hypothetical protein [Variovorax sp. J31P207]MDM0071864.1 hypothetical protein [Variovorax sp. J31P207]